MLRTWWRRYVQRNSRPSKQGGRWRVWPRLLRQPLLEKLEDRLAPASHTWTGNGGNALWSTPGNWSGGAPMNGETGPIILIFDNTGTNRTTTDDIANLRV